MKLKEAYKYIVSDYTRYWGKPQYLVIVIVRALSGIWPGFTYTFGCDCVMFGEEILVSHV